MTKSHPTATATAARWPLWLAALGMLVFGLPFAGLGGYLASLGGSWYFLLAGLGMIVSAVLVAKKRLLGAWLFALIMVLSVIWALADAGLNFWPQISRLFALAVLSLVVALVYPTLRKHNGLRAGRGGYVLAGLLAIGIVAGGYGMFIPHDSVSPNGELPGLTRSIRPRRRRTGHTTVMMRAAAASRRWTRSTVATLPSWSRPGLTTPVM
jgi:quinate dehydrogenase (quinone)